ncbi:ABC transporter ATP-binding protein [Alkalicella caledoniensis]|uniref:ABC transporter ATP-binding protein n=1 Tax=Alkalicella caledoniensis TaxID=2731377 RepID=A0A7G9WBB6_ALKCA|nr:ABC transporter ATP-binding protein [Alkalicella caledoniensis]QNO15978.1 ABC transporter ATP-binding protein [Alkalicella caledoniensis]
MNEVVLALNGVSKKIKKKTIVQDISFSVSKGEVFGFLGPNGAGKTTTIRMIVGLIRPTTGDIRICGNNLTKDFTKAMSHVGCIVENPELYGFMTGMDNLKHFGVMKGHIPHSRYLEVIDLVGLGNRINHKVNTYSLGMKQRLGLAQALLAKPQLLILDEPTNGLDPAGINEFRELIKNLAHEEGMAVFVSSHLLGEVQLMCDRVAIISQGKIVRTDNIEALVAEEEKIIWQVRDMQKGKEIIEGLTGVPIEIVNNGLVGYVNEELIEEINAALFEAGVGVQTIEKKQKSLEDLFLELTRGDQIV